MRMVFPFFGFLLFVFPLLSAQEDAMANLSSVPGRLYIRCFPQDYRIETRGLDLIRRPSLDTNYFQAYDVSGFQPPGGTPGNRLEFSSDGYRSAVLIFRENLRVAPGHPDLVFSLQETGEGVFIEIKLERDPGRSRMQYLGSLKTGAQPKSVLFHPHKDMLFAALLAGYGVDTFSWQGWPDSRRIRHRPIPISEDVSGGASAGGGFVELAFDQQRNRLWVSQMTTAQVHIVDIDGERVTQRIETGGRWSKVIAFDWDNQYAFVSNWLSEDISVISMESYSLLGRIPTGGIPRGLALSPDNSTLYAADYASGALTSISLETLYSADDSQPAAESMPHELSFLEPDILDYGPGAKRHIAVSLQKERIYVSDMMYGRIHVYDLSDGEEIMSRYIGPKLNTIVLDPNEELLYVSSRGRNNPESYLVPGPDFGKIYVLDTDTLDIVDWTWGGNQPTGLDISADGRILAFSDFLDNRIELYDVTALSAVNPLSRWSIRYRNEILQLFYGGHELPAPMKLIQEHPKTGASR